MTLSDQRRLQLCLVILSPARKAEPGLFLFRCFLPKGLRFEHDRKDWPRLEGNRICNKSNPLGMHQCPNAQAYEDYEGKKKEKNHLNWPVKLSAASSGILVKLRARTRYLFAPLMASQEHLGGLQSLNRSKILSLDPSRIVPVPH